MVNSKIDDSALRKCLVVTFISIVIFTAINTATSSELKGLHPKSKLLAYCSNVLAYAGNYYLIQNEEGLVRILLLQHARTYGALLFINNTGDNDPRRAIGLAKSIGSQVKNILDSDQAALPQIVDDCTTKTKNIVNEPSPNSPTTALEPSLSRTFVLLPTPFVSNLRNNSFAFSLPPGA